MASDPTVSRLISTLAPDIDAVLPAIRSARAQARSKVWGRQRPLARWSSTSLPPLVTAHSDKEQRNVVERYFNRLKQFPDLATRNSKRV